MCSRWNLFTCCLSVALLCGCGDTEPASTETSDAGGEGAELGEEQSMEQVIAAEMAKLSEEDRAAAEAQKTCPISGEPLGSMGIPIKVALDGDRSAFVCCAGCSDPLKADPDKHLAKLETNKPEGAPSEEASSEEGSGEEASTEEESTEEESKE